MPENILVVEYEPKYIEKVKSAFAGRPFETTFVHDGEEALRAFDSRKPALIILSSMVPKANTADLIHAARQRAALQRTPILLTVSGYTGSNPKGDAVRFGANDLLPKPYSEADLLQKVQMLLPSEPKLTSDQIFGDLLAEKTPQPAVARKPSASGSDVDKLLADTLSGVMTGRKKDAAAPAKPKTQAGSAELDKLLSDLTMTSRPKTASGSTPLPKPAAALDGSSTNVPISVPIIPKTPPAPPPPPAEEPEPSDGTRFGQYVLLERIATGGMAEVWKARMRGVEGFQKIVAIKKILPHLSDNQDFVDMFIDEAKLAAQLNHSNIIHIYDLGKIQNSYYIAMEYIDGCDLKTILKQGQERVQPLTVELALFIAAKIAAALDYAHRKRDFENKDLGLVHRDVSPQNVLISKEGDIKLCDFGIAKAASKASHTQAGALKGKLQYMSPEQAWGKSIDKRSDVFALATVLFEMLTGRQLFTGDNELSILEQVREARVEPPSKYNDEVTPQIDAMVKKALQKEPADRYQTAGDMARELDAILYEMKPTPTSADLAIYMHRLETSPAVAPQVPEPETAPAPPAIAPAPAPVAARPAEPVAQTPPGVVMPSWEAREEKKKKSSAAPMAIAAVVLVAAIGAGAYFTMRGRPAPAEKPIVTKAQVIPPAGVGAAAPGRSAAGEAPAATPVQTQTTATTSTQPVIDPAQVDAEVAKRLAAERAKLEQQMRARQQAVQAAPPQLPPPILTRRNPEPQPPAQQPAVQPATQTVAQAPPVAPPVTQTVATQTQAPAPQPVEAPKTKLGDLVPSGSEDTVARMIRRADVPYPPMARMERVQGTVLVSALISETGKVLQVKVIRGVNRPVGLNEAAEDIVRRSTFSPPMKDGVRVKAWTTVPVDFKL